MGGESSEGRVILHPVREPNQEPVRFGVEMSGISCERGRVGDFFLHKLMDGLHGFGGD
jgi:hypothetical protein